MTIKALERDDSLMDPYGCFSFDRRAVGEAVQIYQHLCIDNVALQPYVSDTSKQYVFHGSNDGSLRELEPRQNHSSTAFSSLKAVFATDLLHQASLYALINRSGLRSRCAGVFAKDGVLYYFHSVDHEAGTLAGVLCPGYIYVFDRAMFMADPEDPFHWACTEAVKPLACVSIVPEAVPYVGEVWLHDRDRLVATFNQHGMNGAPFLRDGSIHWGRPKRMAMT